MLTYCVIPMANIILARKETFPLCNRSLVVSSTMLRTWYLNSVFEWYPTGWFWMGFPRARVHLTVSSSCNNNSAPAVYCILRTKHALRVFNLIRSLPVCRTAYGSLFYGDEIQISERVRPVWWHRAMQVRSIGFSRVVTFGWAWVSDHAMYLCTYTRWQKSHTFCELCTSRRQTIARRDLFRLNSLFLKKQ